MQRLEKLKSARSIIKIQERTILSELQTIQLERSQIENKIKELEAFSSQAKTNSLSKLINSNHLATTVSFYHKLEQGIVQLRESAIEVEKKYMEATQKYKEITTSRLSITRLVDKYQKIENSRLDALEQKQLEEYVNYKYHV